MGIHQNLEVRSKPLPDNFPELLLSVTAEFGRPILYAKTGRASTLRLVVGTLRNRGGKFMFFNVFKILFIILNIFC